MPVPLFAVTEKSTITLHPLVLVPKTPSPLLLLTYELRIITFDASSASTPVTFRAIVESVIVAKANPPGSNASMMPPLAVFEIAPAHVLQGAVRLHGFTSSPTPETHVRVACANADTVITVDNAL